MLKKILLFICLATSFTLRAEEVSFWSIYLEKLSLVYQNTIQYWKPKVGPVAHRTIEYWSPKVEAAAARANLYFLDKLHPEIINNYQIYLERYGNQAAENLYTSYLYIKPRYEKLTRETLNYYEQNHSASFQYLTDVPAFLKQGYEKSIIKIWQFLAKKDRENLAELSGDNEQSVNMAIAAGQALLENSKSKESKQLNSLLDEIRGAAFDYGMQDCYNVVYFESEILNAFNIGCNIFFSSTLYDFVEGDTDMMRAILAHEVSHGDAGHGIKTMASLAKSGVKNSAKLVMSELIWLTGGGEQEFINKVVDQGLGKIIMQSFASTSVALEVEADQRGAIILNRAGFSAKPLIGFLKKIEGEASDDCNQDELVSMNYRNYPTFCKRYEAIADAMKF